MGWGPHRRRARGPSTLGTRGCGDGGDTGDTGCPRRGGGLGQRGGGPVLPHGGREVTGLWQRPVRGPGAPGAGHGWGLPPPPRCGRAMEGGMLGGINETDLALLWAPSSYLPALPRNPLGSQAPLTPSLL